MADSELRALGDLAAEYADRALTSTVQGVHTAVATRVFDAMGASSALARATHDAVSSAVYGALRLGGRGMGAAISGASRLIGGEEERRTVSSSRFGRASQAAINGLIGDRLEDEENALRIEMTMRLPNRDVRITREDLEAACDESTGRLVVFVHGLCETEEAWWLGTRADPAQEGPAQRTYGARPESRPFADFLELRSAGIKDLRFG